MDALDPAFFLPFGNNIFRKQNKRACFVHGMHNDYTAYCGEVKGAEQSKKWLVNHLQSGTYIIFPPEYLCIMYSKKTSLICSIITINYWKCEQLFYFFFPSWLVNKLRLWILRWIWDQAYLFLLWHALSFCALRNVSISLNAILFISVRGLIYTQPIQRPII